MPQVQICDVHGSAKDCRQCARQDVKGHHPDGLKKRSFYWVSLCWTCGYRNVAGSYNSLLLQWWYNKTYSFFMTHRVWPFLVHRKQQRTLIAVHFVDPKFFILWSSVMLRLSSGCFVPSLPVLCTELILLSKLRLLTVAHYKELRSHLVK